MRQNTERPLQFFPDWKFTENALRAQGGPVCEHAPCVRSSALCLAHPVSGADALSHVVRVGVCRGE